jgi:hypothetical protein
MGQSLALTRPDGAARSVGDRHGGTESVLEKAFAK